MLPAVVFGTPAGAPYKCVLEPKYSTFFATIIIYLKNDALGKPNLEPDVGFQAMSAAFDATRGS